MSSIAQTGLAAYRAGSSQVAENSAKFIASFAASPEGGDPPDSAAAIVAISSGSLQMKAGISLIKVDDALNRSLLDIFA